MRLAVQLHSNEICVLFTQNATKIMRLDCEHSARERILFTQNALKIAYFVNTALENASCSHNTH